jgi:hypothetical protein
MATVLIGRCVVTGCGRIVNDRPGISDARSVQLNARGFTPTFDLRNDPAIFDTRVFDRHDQHLMPFGLSPAGVVGHDTKYSAFSLFELHEYLF